LHLNQKSKFENIFKFDLELIQQWLEEVINTEYSNSIMRSMILPIFANKIGKKLRPIITLNVFRAINGENISEEDSSKIKSICTAIEISHNASLLIDDVFDKDIIRRGEPSFHVKFGTFAALSAGYNLSAFVFDLATRTDNSKIVREIGKVGSALSSALFLSKDLVSNKVITEEFFLDVLYRKTTALFVTAAKCGALLATKDTTLIDKFTQFGEYFGTSYQLRDDVLAIIGSEKDLGKPIESDISNRFQSLITIEAMKTHNKEYLKILNEYYLQNINYSFDKIKHVLFETGAVQKVAEKTIELRDHALQILDEMPDSPSKTRLIDLTNRINFDKYSQYLNK